ncbi:hypothetical protein [Deinococcus sp.]|uniref:hypothetical protein n=1 Tax=Deinococcus sp. TaxID=47478 RepID=UPI003CC6687D
MCRPFLSILVLVSLGSALAASSTLTAIDLGTPYQAAADAATVKDETDYLNSAAADLQVGGRCMKVEVFRFDSAHFQYPSGAQPGTLGTVNARLKAAGFSVKALDHQNDAGTTDDSFLAVRGGLHLLGIVFGDQKEAGLEWCSLSSGTTKSTPPPTARPLPAPVPPPASSATGRLPAGNYHCFIAGQFNAKFDFGSIRLQGDGSYTSQESVRGRYGYQAGSGAVTWSAGLGPDFRPPLVSVYQAADQSIKVTYQLDAANTQFMTCWLGR